MTLHEFLTNWTREFRRCGAQLSRVALDPRSDKPVAIDFKLFAPPSVRRGPQSPEILRVVLEGVEDWTFRPCHTLLEGTLEIELIIEDDKLTRKHLESLDCEGARTEFPDRLLMLRHGHSFVVAQSFEARWVGDE